MLAPVFGNTHDRNEYLAQDERNRVWISAGLGVYSCRDAALLLALLALPLPRTIVSDCVALRRSEYFAIDVGGHLFGMHLG